MKKYITTLSALALAMSTISFAGCGGPDEDPDALGEGETTVSGMTEKEKADAKKFGFDLSPTSPKKD